ncbi:MAG: non-hydrolyzing UDP-N-acetylglucosamine 2-epimerase [Anaerolineales bacterium]
MNTRKQKVLSVFGTRPEAIKMAPVVRELRSRADSFESKVCVTAQHRQMLDQVLELFEITPDYDLNVMCENQTPTQVAAAVLRQLEPVLQMEQPDWVLVQGDTTTVMAASMAAFYARIKVGHVEAGLRTRNKWQPFPEEINRRIAGLVADLHFAPTESSRQNLLCEGVSPESVVVTGNTVIDALQWVARQSATPHVEAYCKRVGLHEAGALPRLILVTAHRRESFGPGMESIFLALRDLAEHYGDTVQLVYPVHPNPNIQEPAKRILGSVSNIQLTEPTDYLTFVHLLKRSTLVLTDSGGIQEEAPSLGVPVLVLRHITERPEAVEADTARLVGPLREAIVREASRLLDDPVAHAQMARAVNPYGDGRAVERIVAALLESREAI